MSQTSIDDCLSFTFAAEGGYQCARGDRMNWSSGHVGEGRLIGTNLGISAVTLIEWVGPSRANLVTAGYMRSLSKTTATAIYGTRYWNPIKGDLLPAGVGLMVFDFGVTSGPQRSAELAQIAAGLGGGDVDGWIGGQTLAAIAAHDPRILIASLAAAQGAFYRRCATFDADGAGWLARLDRRETAALNSLAS